jgi:short-subunit dehydrogenase
MSLKKKLKGKTVLVTGASEGVGKAVAQVFSHYEMKIGLIARSHDKLAEVAKNVEQNGSEVAILKTDLRVQSEIKKSVDECNNKFGVVNFLVNNAGIGFRGRWGDISLESELDTMAINYTAPVTLIHSLLPDMLRINAGHIININTIGGLYTAPYNGAYCASKSALLAYVESLAYELENTSVNISSLFPGPIDTKFLNNPNFTDFKKSPDIVSPNYVAQKVLSVIASPRERIFIGSLLKFFAVKIANFNPRFFRKIIEKKNKPPVNLITK